jgi:DNA-binding CsgD family transcriptional regulator
MTEPRILAVLDLLYASVLDDEVWDQALQSLADYMSARGTFYITADPVAARITGSVGVGIDPIVNTLYQQHYAAVDVRLSGALSIPVGSPFTESQVVERRLYERSEIYGDLLVRYDVPHILGVWVRKAATSCATVVLQRSFGQGAFQRDDQQRLVPVVTHMMRVLRTRLELETLRQQKRAWIEALNRLPFGVLLLDESCRVLEASAAAQTLLRAAQGLYYVNGEVRASFPADDRRLQRAILRTVRPRDDQFIPGDTVSVRRRDGRRSLSVAVIPIRSPGLFLSVPPACILVVFDPESSPKPASAAMKEALHLTDAEALLACVLFTGTTLREASEQLDVSINTCKSQLKSIYAKTDCHSQVDLARTMLLTGLLQQT